MNTKAWRVYTNLYSSTLHKDNGKRYGRGFLEAQIIRTKRGAIELVFTDGAKYLNLKFFSDIDEAKVYADAQLEASRTQQTA